MLRPKVRQLIRRMPVGCGTKPPHARGLGISCWHLWPGKTQAWREVETARVWPGFTMAWGRRAVFLVRSEPRAVAADRSGMHPFIQRLIYIMSVRPDVRGGCRLQARLDSKSH